MTSLFAVNPGETREAGDIGGSLPARLALRGIDLAPRGGRDALDALALVSSRLHAAGDARAAFPEVYAVITRRVLVEVERARSGFLEPQWIDRLMGQFCARYLQTLDWSLRGMPQDCEAWRLAHDSACAGVTIPMQDVLLGISAHVNYDLAQGTALTIVEHAAEHGAGRGAALDPALLARYKRDFDHVNELLRESIEECVTRVRDRYGCRATALIWGSAGPLVARACLAIVAAWREHAWGDVLRLLTAANAAEERAVVRAIDRRGGLIGRSIVGMTAGLSLGRAVLPGRAGRALRGLLVGANALGNFSSLLDLGAAGATGAATSPAATSAAAAASAAAAVSASAAAASDEARLPLGGLAGALAPWMRLAPLPGARSPGRPGFAAQPFTFAGA